MNKVIMITGASSGMGKVTAKKLISEGYKVYTLARRLEAMEDIKELGGYPMQMDVSRQEDIARVVSDIIAREGRIDVLWNNAGFGLYGSVEDIPLEEARMQMEVNLFGLAAVTQAVLPYMRMAGKGLVINTSSVGGKVYFPMGAWYHASKHAVEGLSDYMRLELKPFGIDVVILEPGFIATEFGKVLIDNFEKLPSNSAYAEMMNVIISQTKKTEAEGNNSQPEVIAEAVSKIIRSRKPKTRYRVGKFATPMIVMRSLLSDKVFDKVVMSQIKK